MAKKQQDVNLGKAAIFLGVLCVLGLVATSAAGVWIYGFIGILSGLMAIGCAILWSVTRNAAKRTGN